MFIKTLNETILNIWPQFTIFLIVLISVRILAIRNSSKKFVFHEEFLNLLFIVYILLLYELLTGTENALGSGLNLIPFSEIFRYKIGSKMFIYNVFGNVLLFIPFGYFVSRYINTKKVSQIFIVSLITSTTIELMQLNLGRSFDIDDILLNVIGGILGYFCYVALNAIKNHLPKIFRSDFIYNVICSIILILMILYILSLAGVRWL